MKGNREWVAIKARQSYLENRERILAENRAYRASNRERLRAYGHWKYRCQRELYRLQNKARYKRKGEEIRRQNKSYRKAHAAEISERRKLRYFMRKRGLVSTKYLFPVETGTYIFPTVRVRSKASISLKDLRHQAIRNLGGKCVNCGCDIEDIVQVNHVNGKGDQERRAKTWNGWRLYHAVLNGQRDDLDLRCVPCNWIHWLGLTRPEIARRYRVTWS